MSTRSGSSHPEVCAAQGLFLRRPSASDSTRAAASFEFLSAPARARVIPPYFDPSFGRRWNESNLRQVPLPFFILFEACPPSDFLLHIVNERIKLWEFYHGSCLASFQRVFDVLPSHVERLNQSFIEDRAELFHDVFRVQVRATVGQATPDKARGPIQPPEQTSEVSGRTPSHCVRICPRSSHSSRKRRLTRSSPTLSRSLKRDKPSNSWLRVLWKAKSFSRIANRRSR